MNQQPSSLVSRFLVSPLLVSLTLVILPLGCRHRTDDGPPAEPSKPDAVNVAPDHPSDVAAAPQDRPTDDRLAAQAVKPVSTRLPETAAELKAIMAEHDRNVWPEEMQAQKYEETFVQLWDELIHRSDKFQVLKEFSFNELAVGTEPATETLDWNIRTTRFGEPVRHIERDEWPRWIQEFQDAGYEIIETEFHHSSFEPSPDGANSKVSFLIHALRQDKNERYVVRGNLQVRWQPQPDPATGRFVPDVIDATDLSVMSREGDPAFVQQRVDRFPTDGSGKSAPTTIHPVIVQDLDSDGLPEIVVGGFNLVYRNKGNWKFDVVPLCDHPVPHINAGAFADFDGDGILDYLVAMKNGYPFLYKGEERGQFTTKPQIIKIASETLRVPINVVPGDVDGDGDLDVFIGQQKPGYQTGDIPAPYYDARDSFPSYLLLNDGQGGFTDATVQAGLESKRYRRNFSASLIDFDEDGDLDLIMTSDFSGTDLFANDGHAHFSDVTDTLKPHAYAFGMSHTFGDYDLDGKIDFITVGMSSTTARRLEQLQLGREDFPEHNEARMKMGYGNRLFLRKGNQFVQAPFNQDVARSGWSWGSTTLDFDNDADPDIYIVNGQTSGKTTKDYCTRFWCHDVYYKRGEKPDAAIRELYGELAPLLSGGGISWNGYEHNALLMNIAGHGFVNVGFLMSVSFEFDSRAAVSGDFDGDGRVDLIVENKDNRAGEAKLVFARNAWDQPGHWVGIHLRQSAGGASPIGARVTATLSDGRTLVQHNVAGHSVWAQHANTIHFGLGTVDAIDSINVHWPDGSLSTVANPAIDQYYVVTSAR